MASEIHPNKEFNNNPIEIVSSDGGIVLRQFTLRDSEEIFALIDRTLQSVRESIEHPKNPERLRFAIRNKERQMAGSINLTPYEKGSTRGEVGYYLGSEFQKKGYMVKAVEILTNYGFDFLNYKIIYGDIAEGNISSEKVLLKAGYQETGKHDGKIRYSKNKEQNISQLNTFDFESSIQPISFVETTKVATGVECDVYTFDGDNSKDLGVIRIEPGFKTPLQRVLKGNRTIEGYVSGKGRLVIAKPDGTQEKHSVDNNTQKPFVVAVAIGEKMQWQADKDSPLVAYEICFPPYEDGRYENLQE